MIKGQIKEKRIHVMGFAPILIWGIIINRQQLKIKNKTL